MNYKKILLAFENPKSHLKVLKSGLDVADKYQAELTVLHINTKMAGVPSRAFREFEHKYTPEEVQAVIDENNPNNVKVNLQIESTDHIVDKIVEISEEYDMVVMGHENVNMLASIFTDSMDEQVINKIKCDCLVITLNE